MQRLLTLTSQDFYTGISAGAHVDRGGLWYKADGVNVFRDTTAASAEAGLLQTSPTPTDISSTIAGVPTDYAIDGTDMWFVTSGGDIAKVDLTTDSNCTVVETSISNMGTGCEMFQPSGGSKYLYYFNGNTQLGRHDLGASPGNTDAWSTGLNSTTVRPIVKFEDRLYYGNVTTVGSIYDNAGTPTNDTNVLDLPADMLITALEDDGTFLVIAATTNTALNQTVYGNTRIYFWNTNDSYWTREFEIPDTFITALRRVGDRIYAIGGRGLWVFSYQTRPVKIRSLDTGDVPGSSYHGAISSVNNAVIWGGGGNSEVLSYGEMMQGIGVNNVLHMPYAYSTDIARTTMIAADVRTNKMYTGTGNNNLYRWDLTSGGQTGISAETVYIPLDIADKVHVREVELVFGEAITSSDIINVGMVADNAFNKEAWVTSTSYVVGDVVSNDGYFYTCTAAHTSGASTEPGTGASWENNWKISWGTVDGSNAQHVDKHRVILRSSLREVENISLLLSFVAGNVKIKRINIYGEPIKR